MRLLLASAFSATMALLLPLTAAGQSAAQRQARVRAVHPTPKSAPLALLGTDADSLFPVWKTPDGRTLTIAMGSEVSGGTIPGSASGLRLVGANATAASTGLQFNVSPSLYARAGVGQRSWLSNNADCEPAQPGAKNSVCLEAAPLAGVQSGELGAGYAGDALKLDLSVGQARSLGADEPLAATANGVTMLPRVLPSDAGAAVTTPLWFPDSTTTSLNARSQLRVLPGTQLDLGASQGRVHFLPGAGLIGNDDLNQTTLSLGIEHGPVSGAIVGRMLVPALPGGTPDASPRWSGIDLGVSVRLPWQGELSFGAQNIWSSGKQPLLNPQDVSPDQARVPYVQYHQDL